MTGPIPIFFLKSVPVFLAKDTECVPVSLSYNICCAFQNLQHFTIVGNFLYAKIKSNG